MAEPINFRRDVASPFASAIQGYQLGMGMRQAEEKAAFERQEREFKLQRQQQLSDAFQRLQRPDATGEDYRNAMILSDKDTAKTLQDAFQMRTSEQNETALKKMAPVLFALRVGQNEDAINLLNQEIEANINSNNPQVADALGRYVQILETGGPEAADVVREAWMGEMSFIPGADKVIKNINDVAEGERKRLATPEAGFRPITAEERRAFGLPDNVPFQISPKGEVKEVSRGPMVQVSVDTGSQFGPVPAGYERFTDDAGVVRERLIPGSREEQKLMQEADQAKGRQEQLERAGGTVVQDIMRALNIVQENPAATGRTAAAMLMAPSIVRAETDVQAAKAFVESALSNVGLDTLQRMRENSPTGGALGQVPIQQQQRLEQVLGSLDLTQRKEVVEDNMKRVINIYMDIIHGSPQAINKRFEDGLITQDQKDVYSFRHRLSFDELGNPLPRAQRGRAQQYVPPAAAPAPAAPAAPARGGATFLGFE